MLIDIRTRITHCNDPRKGLIFTDGACLNNGQANPKAGWAFHHGFLSSGQPALAAGRLEKKGPFDSDESEDRAQTSNRAELRAVIAVLGFRHWPGEGFESLVIATDSSYVVEGATKWAKGWVKHGWKTRNGENVKNKDLWEALLGAVEDAKAKGFAVHLWQIPRELNTVADAAAKEAAETQEAPNEWAKIFGMAC
jgi:ribonuclease HI